MQIKKSAELCNDLIFFYFNLFDSRRRTLIFFNFKMAVLNSDFLVVMICNIVYGELH